jgi:flagellar biosynthesis/type III secretory pathway ATPase
MIGHYVTINKSDYSQATGKVISVQDQKISLKSYKGITGVETNVWVTIQDEKGRAYRNFIYKLNMILMDNEISTIDNLIKIIVLNW